MTLSRNERERILHRMTLCMCVGMSIQQTADTLDLPYTNVVNLRGVLFNRTGMTGRVEFAVQQNAAVRELLHA
jgi:DNA-binding CsgD family transcriptional regulator